MSANFEMPEEVRIFLLESYENLDKVEQDLVTLEKDSRNNELLNGIFRSIHTIKGNSGFLGYSSLETLCHRGETLLDKMRNAQLTYSAPIATTLLRLVDTVRRHLTFVEARGEESKEDNTALIREIESHLPR